MRLLLHDPAYVDRLAAFLRSVGLEPRAGSGHELVVDADRGELDVYLQVWSVMHPDAEVVLSEGSGPASAGPDPNML